jgi:microcin C transport system permease protein
MDAAANPAVATPVKPPRKGLLSPTNIRRWQNFRANGRGYWSLWLFMLLFILSLFAEFIANDRPIIASYKGEILFPVLIDYPEEKFGGFLAETDYRSSVITDEINANGWMIWPPIRYSYRSVNSNIPHSAPTAPFWLMTKEERCAGYPQGLNDPDCTPGNLNWLGTDDQARDVMARVIFGARVSILFALMLTFVSALIGIAAGALQGYYGGWVDLLGQRLLEVWSGLPVLYLLIILSGFVEPNFWWLLGIMALFSWLALVDVVRAEFLRGRNLEYVKAARALGLSDRKVIVRHILPNAMNATLSYLPFILTGAISTLTALDFLGFGMPAGSASLGELIGQGKQNLQAPWLGLTAFFTLALILSLLVFIGEALRDAFDPRS